MTDQEQMSAFMAEFNRGVALPEVDPAVLKQWWEASRRMSAESRSNPSVAVGLGAYAGYGFDTSSLTPEQLFSLSMRVNLLTALVERGVLAGYLQDQTPQERVFKAAATMPCGKDDLAEAMIQWHLAQVPPETATKAKEEMRRDGYDPDVPTVDDKFIAWIEAD